MSLTSTGWVSKRYPEIFAELQTSLRNTIHPDLDVSSTSVIGQITAIFAAEIAKQYALGQAVYDSGNRDKAEGKNLDDLAALVGVTRNVSSPSNGTLILTGTNNTTVPAGSTFKTNDNKYVVAIRRDVLISNSVCQKAETQVSSVVNNTAYTISINGGSFSYTSSASATVAEILNGLASTINTFLIANPNAGFTCTSTGTRLVIESTGYRNDVVLILGARLSPDKINMAVTGFVTENGPIAILPETVKVIASPIPGLNSVTNPLEFQYGRNVETDEELRVRMARSVQIAGKATVPAIRAAIENLVGVTSVNILENTSAFSDVNGLPPNSYQVIVEGGEDQEIADTVWETKPAGIQTFSVNGDDGKWIVEDSEGNAQAVYFTRPIPKYLWMKVTANLYNEEVFPPTSGPDAIKASLVEYGKTLGVGKDVICKRFYGSVYSAASGIGNVVITAAYTDSPADTPDPLSFTEIVPVSSVEVSRWDVARIEFEITS